MISVQTNSVRFDRKLLKPFAPSSKRIALTANDSVLTTIVAPEFSATTTADTRPQAQVKRGFQASVLISSLKTLRLAVPLSVLIQDDGDDYLAQTVDMPLYGVGETPTEAIQAVQAQIESVYRELMEDDNFSPDWLNWKKLLGAIVVP